MLPHWLARPQSINRFQSFAAIILRSGSEQSWRLLFTHLPHFDHFDSFLFGVLKEHCKPERSVLTIKMGAVSVSKIYSLISKCIVTRLIWANTVQLWLQERLNQTLAARAKKLAFRLGLIWWYFYFLIFGLFLLVAPGLQSVQSSLRFLVKAKSEVFLERDNGNYCWFMCRRAILGERAFPGQNTGWGRSVIHIYIQSKVWIYQRVFSFWCSENETQCNFQNTFILSVYSRLHLFSFSLKIIP